MPQVRTILIWCHLRVYGTNRGWPARWGSYTLCLCPCPAEDTSLCYPEAIGEPCPFLIHQTAVSGVELGNPMTPEKSQVTAHCEHWVFQAQLFLEETVLPVRMGSEEGHGDHSVIIPFFESVKMLGYKLSVVLKCNFFVSKGNFGNVWRHY